MTILNAYGITTRSMHEVSVALQELQISHSVVGGFGRTLHMDIDGLCTEQPAWPVVIQRVTSIHKVKITRDPLVYFVCDSRAALSETNVRVYREPAIVSMELREYLKFALVNAMYSSEPWKLDTKSPSVMDYVNIASKPSFLNLILTAVYKITPYALRKEVQALCIAYLAGATSLTKVKTKLKTNLRLEYILSLMVSPKARELREAVLQLRAFSVDLVAKATGFEEFELNYLSKSHAKLMEQTKARVT